MNDSATTAALTRRQLLWTLGAAGAALGLGRRLRRFGPGGVQAPHGRQAVRRTGFALGTRISILALHEERRVAQAALAAAWTELETVEAVMSLYRPQSELCRLNREGLLLRPHPYLVRLLEQAQAMSVASGGDFDVTVQPLWTLYAGAKRYGRLPSAAEIERARRRVDWRRVEVGTGRIRLAGRGTAVTLNGIAQGFATDRVLEALIAGGVRQALVDTGEIGALGRRRDGKRWTVAIQHPRRKQAYIWRAGLEGGCVATSGDYATTFSPDRAHHHIFDPRSGRSAGAFQSVTVRAASGLVADALSTAVFVAGLERGRALIEASPGAAALFVLKTGEIRATAGFPGRRDAGAPAPRAPGREDADERP